MTPCVYPIPYEYQLYTYLEMLNNCWHAPMQPALPHSSVKSACSVSHHVWMTRHIQHHVVPSPSPLPACRPPPAAWSPSSPLAPFSPWRLGSPPSSPSCTPSWPPAPWPPSPPRGRRGNPARAPPSPSPAPSGPAAEAASPLLLPNGKHYESTKHHYLFK